MKTCSSRKVLNFSSFKISFWDIMHQTHVVIIHLVPNTADNYVYKLASYVLMYAVKFLIVSRWDLGGSLWTFWKWRGFSPSRFACLWYALWQCDWDRQDLMKQSNTLLKQSTVRVCLPITWTLLCYWLVIQYIIIACIIV